jgi:hypothetical protein
MRSSLLLASAFVAALTAAATAPSPASAQRRGEQGRNEDSNARRERQRREWTTPQARLDGERNTGPCPFVKVLYDAGRFVEFTGGREAAAAVAWTGEIQGVEAECRYQDGQPIRVDVNVAFTLGRGPQAQGRAKTYRWWVAVTERNRQVIAKEYFALNAEFRPGQDRLAADESLGGITIPRKNNSVSGNNFEILIGFDVTPEMAAFNRDGKRFRATAGEQAQTSGQTQTGQTATR